MTGPAVPHEVGLEEMEAELQAPAPDPQATKLEGDDIPDEFKGKSVKDIIEQQKRLSDALRISEAERLRALETRQPAPAAPAPTPEPAYVPLTKEKIQEMYEEDPLKAIEAINNDALRRADEHFNRRFAQLEGSLASTQESWARQEFADEFKVLGDDIQALISQIPDKSVLNTKKSWEDLISYVRGQRGNFEKLWEFKQSGKPPKNGAQAREEQVADAGFSPRPTVRSETPTSTGSLDATSRRVMEVLGTFKNEEEYIKWQRMGAVQ